MNIKLLNMLRSKNIKDIYEVSRFCYKYGIDFIKDELYDAIEVELKEEYPDWELFNHHYEDDDPPEETLKKYMIEVRDLLPKYEFNQQQKLFDYQDHESISQKPIRSYEDAYEWFRLFNNKDICFSVKIDGIAVKRVYSKNGYLLAAYSKGKEGKKKVNFTDTVSRMSPVFKDTDTNSKNDFNVLTSECFMTKNGLRISESTGDGYANERSGALGILTNCNRSFLISHLEIYCYGGNIEKYKAYSENLKYIESLGVKTVPHLVSNFKDTGFENFKIYIDDIQKKIKEMQERANLPADGIVARVDNLEECSEEDGRIYSDFSIALKFGEYKARKYTATVKDIVFDSEGNSEKYTISILINPIKIDNKTIQKITGYNLSYLISKNIKVGSEIEVLYQSGCYPEIAR